MIQGHDPIKFRGSKIPFQEQFIGPLMKRGTMLCCKLVMLSFCVASHLGTTYIASHLGYLFWRLQILCIQCTLHIFGHFNVANYFSVLFWSGFQLYQSSENSYSDGVSHLIIYKTNLISHEDSFDNRQKFGCLLQYFF